MQSWLKNIRFILEVFFCRPVAVICTRKCSVLVCIKIISFLCKGFPILTAILYIQNSSVLIFCGTRAPQRAGDSPRHFVGHTVWGKLFWSPCYKYLFTIPLSSYSFSGTIVVHVYLLTWFILLLFNATLYIAVALWFRIRTNCGLL
jgi:hypothetical protein